jgi:hypothetical protein
VVRNVVWLGAGPDMPRFVKAVPPKHRKRAREKQQQRYFFSVVFTHATALIALSALMLLVIQLMKTSSGSK